MRAIWKGAISFGLVSIPVKLYTATEERDVSFHQVHRSDGGRIRYRRVCSADGEEVPYSDIAKGYELPGGEMVVLTDEDLADLPLTTSRVVEVLSFVPLEQVDPIYFAKTYYLEPDKTAAKPYVLLRDALERSDMVALVKVAIRTRETLATLRVRDRVMVLETMIWPDEVRAPEFGFLDDDVSVRPQELSMAESLIASMAADFDPTQYHDEYREALQQVVQAKIEGREVVEPQPEVPVEAGGVVDLMAALQASVAAAKRSRGEPAEEEASAQAAAPAAEAGSPAAADGAAKTAGAKRGAGSSSRAKPTGAATAAGRSGRSAAKKSAAGGSRAAQTGTSADTPAKTTRSTARSASKASPSKASPSKAAPAKTTSGKPAAKTTSGKPAAKKTAKKAAARSA